MSAHLSKLTRLHGENAKAFNPFTTLKLMIGCLPFSRTVPRLDKHGRKVKFDRERILDLAISTVDILRMVHTEKDINQKYYLIAIFGEE